MDRGTGGRTRAVASALVGWLLFFVGMVTIPHRWCAREGRALFEGDAELQGRLARGVEFWISSDLGRGHFQTGYSRFDGEWLLGTYQMAGLGFGQTALQHPQWRARHLGLMERCLDRLLSPELRAFDREAWSHDPLETLDGPEDHAAYLGYANLLLSYHRTLAPASKYADLNDRISAALARRILASPTALLQTYPGEAYPIDNSAAIGSLALHRRATGKDDGGAVRRWLAACRKLFVDPKTGLLYQAVHAPTGKPTDAPRGSGTGLAIYFLSFADPGLSRDLFDAVRAHLADSILGFGTIREYPPTVPGGAGDIDSGPVVFGQSVSATGFALAGSRLHGDPDLYSRLYSTAFLFGAPVDRGDRRHFVTGGPLGDSLLFALLTARPLAGGVTRP